jgi:hypothetical protein
MMLPAGVRELCGQAYVEVEVAAARSDAGEAVAWRDAAWPLPSVKSARARMKTRLSRELHRQGLKWGHTTQASAGKDHGESSHTMGDGCGLAYAVKDTQDISAMLHHRMIKDGLAQMLRVAPEVQHKIMAALVERKDVNLKAATAFLRALVRRGCVFAPI